MLPSDILTNKRVVTVQCKIEEMPQSRIAYMRRTGPYGEGNYALMKKFKQWVKAKCLVY
mgnify:CR=1 FL=1